MSERAFGTAARPRRFGRIFGLALVATLGLSAIAFAHPTGFALLTVDVVGERVDAAFRVSGTGERARSIEVRFPAHCEERAPTTTRVSTTGIDRGFRLRCPPGLFGELSIAGLPVDLQARVEVRGSQRQTAVLDAGRPRMSFAGSSQGTFARYLRLGVEHILFGVDHVLFVLALVGLVAGFRRLLWTVSAFTLGHSVTLALASLGWVTVPAPPVEACIALSILLAARELWAFGTPSPATLVRRRPELAAALFGLLHGLGFAGALAEVGLPEDALVEALFAFNLGVELGQVGIVAVFGSVLLWVTRRAPDVRSVRMPLAYALGAMAAYWTLERALVVLGV